MQMNTKLAINLKEGTVEVEGDEAFVRFIYDDFKESLSKHAALRTAPQPALDQAAERPLLTTGDSKRIKKSPARKKGGSGDNEKSRGAHTKPKYNAKLDLTRLPEFYDEWKPSGNSEKILVFAVFLRDHLRISPCSADDIFTCFFGLKSKTKTPEAFQQAFINAKNRTHYIEFKSTDSIEITIAGDNWFTEQAKKLREPSK